MGSYIIGAVLLLLGLMLVLPAIIVTWRAAVNNHRMREWTRTTGYLVRVETATAYIPDADGSGGHTQTYLMGVYHYADPRGGIHWGRSRVRGVNLGGGPQPMPILVDPANWDRSCLVPSKTHGCLVALVWVTALFGFVLVLAGILGLVAAAAAG